MKSSELTAMAATLKPCPFCGGKADLVPLPGSRNWWKVQCRDYLCGGRNWGMDEPEKAVAAWNRRASVQE